MMGQIQPPPMVIPHSMGYQLLPPPHASSPTSGIKHSSPFQPTAFSAYGTQPAAVEQVQPFDPLNPYPSNQHSMKVPSMGKPCADEIFVVMDGSPVDVLSFAFVFFRFSVPFRLHTICLFIRLFSDGTFIRARVDLQNYSTFLKSINDLSMSLSDLHVLRVCLRLVFCSDRTHNGPRSLVGVQPRFLIFNKEIDGLKQPIRLHLTNENDLADYKAALANMDESKKLSKGSVQLLFTQSPS